MRSREIPNFMQASSILASFVGDAGDGGGDKVVDIAIQRIQLALAVPNLAEQGLGGGGDAFRGGGGGAVATRNASSVSSSRCDPAIGSTFGSPMAIAPSGRMTPAKC